MEVFGHINRLKPLWLSFYLVLLINIISSQFSFGQNSSIPNAADLLSRYVAIPSVSGHEKEAGEFFARECEKAGLFVHVLTRDSGKFNFVASLYPLSDHKPNILLLNHIDVVDPGKLEGWTHDPFSGKISSNEVWGRGSIDNKGMGVMQLEALRQFVPLAAKSNLSFNASIVCVSGEEVGGKTGAKIVADDFIEMLNPVVLLGEGGTGMDSILSSNLSRPVFGVAINNKKSLWLKLTLHSSGIGHGSVPTDQNVNQMMIDALNRLIQRKKPLVLSSSSRIMFSGIGENEFGFKGFALRHLGLFKNLAQKGLRKEPVIQAILTNTINLTKLNNPEGSNNMVPQSVEAILDCRLLPETRTDEFINKIHKIMKLPGLQVEILNESRGADDSNPDIFYHMLEKAILQVYPGAAVIPILFPATDDSNYFRSHGLACFGILPIYLPRPLIASIHNFNERIGIESLVKGVSVYEYFIRQILESNLSPSAITQTVRGHIYDKSIALPISEGLVLLQSDTGILGVASINMLGDFKFQKIPLGRHKIKVISSGYREINLDNIIVNSGHETILRIGLEETAAAGHFSSAFKLPTPMNEMATAGVRTFDAEEASRYPGSRDDPARMVANFAGVRGADDSRNDIIIRGNSPFSLGWRIENIDLPNPNHYAITGTSGGGVNLLNNRMLERSDFYSGTMPSEYGNALAGVFDLRMKKGNDKSHEFSLATGSIFTEVMAEGPLNKNKGWTYLFSLRRSTLGLISRLSGSSGLSYARSFGIDAIPKYTDASFKLEFPLKSGMSIKFFGIGGKSSVLFEEAKRDPCSFSYQDHGQDVDFKTNMGVTGIIYQTNPAKNLNIEAGIYSTYSGMYSDRVRIFRDSSQNIISKRREKHADLLQLNPGIMINSGLRLSARNAIKFGANLESQRIELIDTLIGVQKENIKDRLALVKAFVQWKHRFNKNLSVAAGMNALYMSLVRNMSIDPRAGLIWNIDRSRSIRVGVGIHSQLQPTYFYYQMIPDGKSEMPNLHIGPSRSIHLSAAYDFILTERVKFTIEGYLQHLYNIPVEQKQSSWSMVNQGLDFKFSYPGPLSNKGIGNNFGIEFTLERNYQGGYYYLYTLSIYDSKYTGSDGILRNTDYNGNFIMNFVAGKDFRWSTRSTFTIGIRSAWAGGRRYSPVDPIASAAASRTIFVDSLAFSKQFPDYFHTDLRIGYKYNTSKLTHEFNIDFMNIIPVRKKPKQEFAGTECNWFPLANPNPLARVFEPVSGLVKTEYQLGFLPVINYRLSF